MSNITPVVFVGARPRQQMTHSVSLDDISAGKNATQHLLELGHRAIGMVTGPMEEDCTQDRMIGFKQALEEVSIEHPTDFTAPGGWSASSGYEGFKKIVSSGTIPTAIFAQNDQIAVGVIRAAKKWDCQCQKIFLSSESMICPLPPILIHH